MAIEIVDSPTKNGDFPYSYVSLPEGTTKVADEFHFASISMSQFPDVSRV